MFVLDKKTKKCGLNVNIAQEKCNIYLRSYFLLTFSVKLVSK